MSYFNLYRTNPSLEAILPQIRLRFKTDEEYTRYLISQPYNERLAEREYTLTNGSQNNPVKLPPEVDDFVYALKSGKVNQRLNYDFYKNIKLNMFLDAIVLPSAVGATYNKLPCHYMLPLFKTFIVTTYEEDLHDEHGNVVDTRTVTIEHHYVEIMYLEPNSPLYGKCCTLPMGDNTPLTQIYLKDNWWIFKVLQPKFDHDLTVYFSEKGLNFMNAKLNAMNNTLSKTKLTLK